MTTLTARKSIRISWQPVGFGVMIAGMALTASIAIIMANPAARDAQVAPAISRFVGTVPHQVAPLAANDTTLGTTSIVPATSSFVGGVPHQVAPLAGSDTTLGTTSIVPATSSFVGGVPHQVAPLAASNE